MISDTSPSSSRLFTPWSIRLDADDVEALADVLERVLLVDVAMHRQPIARPRAPPRRPPRTSPAGCPSRRSRGRRRRSSRRWAIDCSSVSIADSADMVPQEAHDQLRPDAERGRRVLLRTAQALDDGPELDAATSCAPGGRRRPRRRRRSGRRPFGSRPSRGRRSPARRPGRSCPRSSRRGTTSGRRSRRPRASPRWSRTGASRRCVLRARTSAPARASPRCGGAARPWACHG